LIDRLWLFALFAAFANQSLYAVLAYLRDCGGRSSLSDKLNDRILATAQLRQVWANGLWVIAAQASIFDMQLTAVRLDLIDEKLGSVQLLLLSYRTTKHFF
jgi:hypothetical protein